MKNYGLLSFLLLITCFISYGPALRGGLLWDDSQHIVTVDTERSVDGLKQIWTNPSFTQQYYPLSYTSFWFEAHLWGERTLGYHIINILFHAANACLVAWILTLLGFRFAWLAAYLFALHPVQAETVAWISELKNTQSTFFFLTSTISFLYFVKNRKISIYVLSLVLFLAALLSKTITCMLPVILFLLLYARRGSIHRSDILFLTPFILAGMGLGLMTVHLEKAHVGAVGSMWDFRWYDRLEIAGRALAFYAGKLLWPSHLTFMYPRWHLTHLPVVGIGLALLYGLFILSLWSIRKRRTLWPCAASLIYFVALAPALGFFNVYPMRYTYVADHFQYLASLVVLSLIAWFIHRADMRLQFLFVATLGFLTWERAHVFQNAWSLWNDTLAKNPACAMAHNNIACVLLDQGRVLEARAHALESIRLDPKDSNAQLTLGDIYYFHLKQYKLALQHYQLAYGDIRERKTLATEPLERADVLGFISNVYRDEHRLPEAQAALEEALQALQDYRRQSDKGHTDRNLNFREARVRDELAGILTLEKKYKPALAHLRLALALEPNALPIKRHLQTIIQFMPRPAR